MLMERIGNYVLIQSLFHWGWSEVFLAIHAPEGTADKVVWLARLNSDFPWNKTAFIEDYTTLLQELNRQLTDPILVTPQIFEPSTPEPYLVFELIQGLPLSVVVSTSREQFLPLTVDHALLIVNQLNTGLQFLHQLADSQGKMFHGCINPDQVFITDEGQVKVILGAIFKALAPHDSIPHSIIDPLQVHLSPEQLTGNPGNPRSDVYSAAFLALELFNNEILLNRPADTREWLASSKIYLPSGEPLAIPDSFTNIFLQALQEDPQKRLKNIDLFKNPLDDLTFGGEYEASTFNLAFYINTLLQNQFEQQRKLQEGLLKQDYSPLFESKTVVVSQIDTNISTLEPDTLLLSHTPEETEGATEIIELEATETPAEDVIMPEIAAEEDLYPAAMKARPTGKKFPIVPAVMGLLVIAVIAVVAFLFMRPKAPISHSPSSPSITQTNTPQPNPEIEKLNQKIEEQKKTIEDLKALLAQVQQAQPEGEENEKVKELQAKLEQYQKQVEEMEKERQQKEAQASSQPHRTPEVPLEKAQGNETGTLVASNTDIGKNESQPLPAGEKSNGPSGPGPSPPSQTHTGGDVPEIPSTNGKDKPLEFVPENPSNKTADTVTPSNPTPENVTPKSIPLQTPTPNIVEPVLAAQTDQGVTGFKAGPGCKPEYPSLLRIQKLKGVVVYKVTISRTGDIESVTILRSPHKLFSKAVEEALQRTGCSFGKGTVQGKPVRVEVTGTFNFH